jgi:hypothetical protein
MRDLQPIVHRLTQVRAELLAVAERVPAESWREKPAPQKWSAAEVVAHLTQVEAAIVDGMEKLLRSEPRPVPFWKRLHIPPRVSRWRFFRAETPLPLEAALLADKAAMLARFAAGRARTLKLLETHGDKDLGRWRYPHPFFGSLNGYAWFKNIYHHEVRHTAQLREIARAVGG